jgi:hypothetical protein
MMGVKLGYDIGQYCRFVGFDLQRESAGRNNNEQVPHCVRNDSRNRTFVYNCTEKLQLFIFITYKTRNLAVPRQLFFKQPFKRPYFLCFRPQVISFNGIVLDVGNRFLYIIGKDE